MRKSTFVLLASAVLGLGAITAGCGGSDDTTPAASATGAAPTGPASIKVASDIPYAPFEFTEPGSSDVLGFDVDVVKAVAATFGTTDVTFVKRKFDTILLDVQQNRFDMAASSITITPERAKTVAFSDPYFLANQSIMVKKGSAIKTEADLKGTTLGVQRGTTGATLAAKITGTTLKQYEIIDDAFLALQNGRVEAVINDFPISAYATKSKPELEVVSQIDTKESYGFAFSQENTSLRDLFNAGLTKIKADGTYATIYKKWFNQDPPVGS
jgi:ABC-type amino acid transport substrate-binding protein